MTSIRPATLADLAWAQRCARAAYAQYVPVIGKEPAPMHSDFESAIRNGHLSIIAEEEATPLGYMLCYPKGGAWLIENVAVLPEHQGRGLGRKLIDHAEQAALAAGLSTVALYTHRRMEANIALYKRLGYRETARRTEEGFDRVFFEKRIATDDAQN